MINTVESLNSGILVLQLDSQNTSVADQIKTLCNPFIKAPSTIIKTEHGYTVIIPPQNIGGEKISINRIGPDQYLVVTERPVYGSKPKYEIYTEEELVAKYGSNKKPQNSPPVLHTKA